MQSNLKKVPILLLLLTTQCTFIAAADDGPAGAGSGASSLPTDAALPDIFILDSLENIVRFEDMLIRAILNILPILSITYPPESSINIMKIIEDISILHKKHIKMLPCLAHHHSCNMCIPT
jgi:hypothetical protein